MNPVPAPSASCSICIFRFSICNLQFLFSRKNPDIPNREFLLKVRCQITRQRRPFTHSNVEGIALLTDDGPNISRYLVIQLMPSQSSFVNYFREAESGLRDYRT